MRKILKKTVTYVTAFAVAFSGMVIPEKQTATVLADSEYSLVWSEEFNGDSLNRSNWNVEVNGDGGGNNELQYYCDDTKNIEVSGGTLKIHALKENYMGKNYTSGRITTQGKQEFKYGKVEARIKVPSFSGAWPAFWMLGANYRSVGWPACGEIDIMEAINTENKTYSTVHWSYNGNHADSGLGTTVTNRTDWHVYGVEWDSKYMRFYVDGEIFFEQDINVTSSQMGAFRKEYFIILNLAIGGNWPQWNIDDSAFPDKSTMEVDYVRVYQKESYEEEYTGPTVTVEQDSVKECTSTWGSWFGGTDGNGWSGATGTMTAATTAAEGFTVNATAVGTERWGMQATLYGLPYYPGNTYTYKCTITSDTDRKIFVKVAGDNADEISGQYINLKAGVPYNYQTSVYIDTDYEGALDLAFGLGRCEGENISENTAFNLTVTDVSFTATATIPDPDYIGNTDDKQNANAGTTNDKQNANVDKSDVSDTKLARAKIKKIVRKKNNKKIKVKIKKVAGATKYQIKYSTSKKFKKKKTKIVTTKKRTYTLKKLNPKKKYYIKVRAFKKVDGEKVYGKWSKKKKVAVRK